MIENYLNKIIEGNVLEVIKDIPDNSIDTIITSPPYWGLRNYGKETETIWDGDKNCEHIWKYQTYKIKSSDSPSKINRWNENAFEELRRDKPVNNSFCQKCGAWRGQLGMEPTLGLYLGHMLQITKELFRVLKPTGTFWFNMGTSYSDGRTREIPKKCDTMQNYRLVQRMIDEQGGILRGTVIWWKANAMPSSVKDRFTVDYEPVFFFVKSNNVQYWVNERTGQSTWKKPKGINGVEGIDWDWREVGNYDWKEGEEIGYTTGSVDAHRASLRGGLHRFNTRVRDSHKDKYLQGASPEEIARKYGYNPEEICPICGRSWKEHASNVKDWKEGIRREFIPCRKQDNVPSKNANTYTGFNERWRVKQTKIPEEQAENFGSPCARYHRKQLGKIKKVSNWRGRDYWFEMEYEPFQESSLVRVNYPSFSQKTNTGIHGGMTLKNQLEAFRKVREGESLGRHPRCVWKIPTSPYKEAHFACVDSETEALTIGGWKRFDELKIGQPLASFDIEKGILRYEPLLDLVIYDYEGEMIKIRTLQTDMLLTPSHRIISKRWNRRKNTWDKWGTIQAGDITDRDRMPVIAEWEEGTYGLLPSPNPDMAELIGWIIAEGCVKKHTITIYQSISNKKYVDRIKSLLDSLNIKYRFKVNKKKYKDGIKENGYFFLNWYSSKDILAYTSEKTFEPYMMLWSRECLERLLQGFVLGDGHIRGNNRISITQKNLKNVDLLQYLCFRLGKRTIVSKNKRGLFIIYLTNKKCVSIRSTMGKINRESINYKGRIWCPRLPSGTWVARRNGRIFITGNTFPPALVKPMIKAGCPEEICKKCGLPRERIGEIYSDCGCDHSDGWNKGIILDPFMGSGTVGVVAKKLFRNFIGIELNSNYVKMANKRINNIDPLFNGGDKNA